MNVYVLIILIGMETGVKIQDVLEVKVGMVVNAFAQMDKIIMDQPVYNVLMGKYGISEL